MNLIHIESRLSNTKKENYEFFVDCKARTKEELDKTVEELKSKSTYLQILKKDQSSEYDQGGKEFLNDCVFLATLKWVKTFV